MAVRAAELAAQDLRRRFPSRSFNNGTIAGGGGGGVAVGSTIANQYTSNCNKEGCFTVLRRQGRSRWWVAAARDASNNFGSSGGAAGGPRPGGPRLRSATLTFFEKRPAVAART